MSVLFCLFLDRSVWCSRFIPPGLRGALYICWLVVLRCLRQRSLALCEWTYCCVGLSCLQIFILLYHLGCVCCESAVARRSALDLYALKRLCGSSMARCLADCRCEVLQHAAACSMHLCNTGCSFQVSSIVANLKWPSRWESKCKRTSWSHTSDTDSSCSQYFLLGHQHPCTPVCKQQTRTPSVHARSHRSGRGLSTAQTVLK